MPEPKAGDIIRVRTPDGKIHPFAAGTPKEEIKRRLVNLYKERRAELEATTPVPQKIPEQPGEGRARWAAELEEMGITPPAPTSLEADTGTTDRSLEQTFQAGLSDGKTDAERAIENIAIGASRYGLPILGAIGGIPGITVGAGLGEFMASEYEDYFNNEKYNNLASEAVRHAENIGKGLLAGGLAYTGAKGVDALTSKISGKVPAIFGKGAKSLAQARRTGGVKARTLIPKEIPREIETSQRVLREMSTPEEKYAVPVHLINKEEGNWIRFLGDTAESALFGKKRMIGSKERILRALSENVKRFGDITDDYLTYQSQIKRPKEFAELLKGMLTREINLVEGLRKELYGKVDDIIANSTKNIDGGLLRGFFTKEIGRKHVRKIYREVSDLLPSLKEMDSWKELDLRRVDNVLKRINSLWPRATEAERSVLNHVKKQIEPQLNRVLKQTTFRDTATGVMRTAFDIREEANKFFQKKQDRLYNVILKKVFKSLEQKPNSVLSMFKDTRRERLGNLEILERAFMTGPKEFRRREFEKNILKPLQHGMLSGAADIDSGIINGTTLARILDKNPAFTAKVWGDEAAQRLRDFATAIQTMESTTRGGDKVFIKFVQGGILTSGLGAAAYGQYSDEPVLKRIGAATFLIFMSPALIGRIMSNPNLSYKLTSQIIAGNTKTPAFAKLMTVLGTQKRMADMELRKLPIEARNFYQTFQGNSLEEEDAIQP